MDSVKALLQNFHGYLELGMYQDANDELEKIDVDAKTDPEVLHARLILLVEMRRWEDGAILGDSLSRLWPEELEFYFKTAYCLHEMKRTAEAKATLQSAPQEIRETALYAYNLACYEAQLGNITAAKQLLSRCFALEPGYKEEFLDDPDLEPLWNIVVDADNTN